MFRLLADRRVLLSAALIISLAAVAFWPKTFSVELAAVVRGPLVVTVDEEGRTRVRERFVVSAPVAGHVLRLELEPGDRVARGDVVARIRPESPVLLDARARAEAMAAVTAAEASLGHARAEEQRALAAMAHADRELARTRQLTAAGATARQSLDGREADAALASAAVRAAAFAVRSASADIERARSRLMTTSGNAAGAAIAVRSPADGVVLQRLRHSESPVAAGEPLVTVGEPRRLEIVTDLLSTDAVGVRPGARAIIDQWGGNAELAAQVRRIEPGGFTKVSALGVEEQRVNVVLDIVGQADACELLGDAYRVEARIVLWEAPDVLKVPTSALFRYGAEWAVYVAQGGRARRAIVSLGHQTGQEAEVTTGLAEGMMLVVHPGDLVDNGVRIAPRNQLTR